MWYIESIQTTLHSLKAGLVQKKLGLTTKCNPKADVVQ